MHFRCLKPSSLWQLVTATTGNEYRSLEFIIKSSRCEWLRLDREGAWNEDGNIWHHQEIECFGLESISETKYKALSLWPL